MLKLNYKNNFIDVMPVLGYENYYVDQNGTVYSLQHTKIKALRACRQANGYYSVMLCQKGKIKNHYVHRLVWEAWNTRIPKRTHNQSSFRR